MRLEGKLRKSGEKWIIQVPALDVMTQGRSRAEAYEMLKDAIELLVKKKGFHVTVHASLRDQKFSISANDQDRLIALLLRRQRQKHGLTLREMAHRLGGTSVNTFARYEQGKARPTVAKLVELLQAISPDKSPMLVIAG